MPNHLTILSVAGLFGVLGLALAEAKEPTWDSVVPVLERVCWDCHGDLVQEGEVKLSGFQSEAEAMANHRLWQKVFRLVEQQQMPPPEGTQPSDEERELMLRWIDTALNRVAQDNAGDPGHVTLRRLNNSEYDNTIRDLTGHEFALSRGFGRDPGGGEGFTNTGDVLFISPEQLQKYLDAARHIASHASALPGSGVEFHAETVPLRGPATVSAQLSEQMRTWYLPRLAAMLPETFEELRVSAYLFACWQHEHGQGTLAELAEQHNLDPVFLENWWAFLQNKTSNPVLKAIREPWHALPDPGREDEVQRGVAAMEADLHLWMKELQHINSVERNSPDESFFLCVADMGDGNRGDYVHWTGLEVIIGREDRRPLFDYVEAQIAEHERLIAEGSGERSVLEQRLKKLQGILARKGTAPDGVDAPDDGFTVQAPSVVEIWLPAEVRVLKGGSHVVEGHADSKLASIQATLLTGTHPPELPHLIPGVRFEHADKSDVSADFSRALKSKSDVFPGGLTSRLEESEFYMRRGSQPQGIYYLHYKQFAERLPEHERKIPPQIARDLRMFYLLGRNILGGDEQKHWNELMLGHLTDFATRAYRRPLTEDQSRAIRDHYHSALSVSDNREEAAREVIVRILVSPAFLYKTELPGDEGSETALDPWDLASRLSYFLWASMPDQALRAAAADGSLLDREVLDRQVTRMLADPKSAALGREFAAQWLGLRHFEQDIKIDRELYPEFDDELRASLSEEIQRFFVDLITEDRPITDILHGRHTFLNKRLAEHYGIQDFRPDEGDSWARWPIDEPRGGILGSGAVLAATSFPDRASPVRRGHWILTTLMGDEMPPVPADVPELASDGLAGTLSIRERLQKHRDSASCRGCHSRIDPPGFALQNFDAIGRWRVEDPDGRPIDATATLTTGESFTGPQGLKNHLTQRRGDFLRQFSRKLLGYALGREVILTDRPLLKSMESELQQADYRFSVAVRAIVHSRQFLYRRNP